MEIQLLILALIVTHRDTLDQETTPEILHQQAMNTTARTSESHSNVTDNLHHKDLTTHTVMVSSGESHSSMTDNLHPDDLTTLIVMMSSGEYLTASSATTIMVSTYSEYLIRSNATTPGKVETYIFFYTNTALTSVGFVANIMAWITMINRKEGLNKVIVLLLQHQSVIDAIVCLISLSFLITSSSWYTGIKILDTLLCHIWYMVLLCLHGQSDVNCCRAVYSSVLSIQICRHYFSPCQCCSNHKLFVYPSLSHYNTWMTLMSLVHVTLNLYYLRTSSSTIHKVLEWFHGLLPVLPHVSFCL